LYEQAKNFEKQFKSVTYGHILRSFNKRADRLANQVVENYQNLKINVCVDDNDSSTLSVEEDLHHLMSLHQMK
jgi:ribonuclease HI